MNRFIVISIPADQWLTGCDVQRGLPAALASYFPGKWDDVQNGLIPSPFYMFKNDIEAITSCDILAKRFPAWKFAYVEMTSFSQCAPGVVKKVEVNEKGVLPA